MKKYLFISLPVYGFGGVQRYIESRRKHLVASFWMTRVITIDKTAIVYRRSLIPQDEIIAIPYIDCSPSVCSNHMVEKIVEYIKHKIKYVPSDNVVVESLSPWRAHLWGEMIAAGLNAKHVAQFMDEYYPGLNAAREFYAFKVRRQEAFAASSSIARLVAEPLCLGGSKQIAVPPFPTAEFLCDQPDALISDIGERYSILLVSRLNNPYVDKVISQLVIYFKKHPSFSFYLAVIGDAVDKGYRRTVESKFASSLNVRLDMLGFQPSVSRELFAKFDVVIAKATTATICASTGVPTICFHQTENRPMGFLGYDCPSALSSEGDRGTATLSGLLDEALLGNRFVDEKPKYPIDLPKPDFSEHDAIAFNSRFPRQYFDTRSIKTGINDYVTIWLRRIFGIRNQYIITNTLHKIRTSIKPVNHHE